MKRRTKTAKPRTPPSRLIFDMHVDYAQRLLDDLEPAAQDQRASALIWPPCTNCGVPVEGYDPEPSVDGHPCCSKRCALGDWLADQNGCPPAYVPPAFRFIKAGEP